ncbi:sulfate ABC transporter substrate-binding protein [Cohnella endophytica]|uniref:Sulfate ABC transporter substrate-binding protein n=1 Tax=Cohnella endophytica TaxID=2419778 RepID=A0A494XL39_9BACL|nr:sulfate ABC transporter substrate-binding protein [Cohnella endophytica]RKP48774.1 sulfate ABC transporter substrate-binding protein [Cohnella endophytica]
MKKPIRLILLTALAFILSTTTVFGAVTKKSEKKSVTLLNVSYDPTRELYVAYNAAFAKYWEKKTGQKVTIKQSHGGSGAQARSVIDGLEADVVTLALEYDVTAIEQKGLIAKGWQKRLANNSAPYKSTIVFLVRKGNPKNIKDWDDLVKPGVSVITPNPKTSGGARWNYLAAWGYALKNNNNSQDKAKDFVKQLFQNVPVLDTGARGSTNTFVEKGIGDVLIAWENEAYLSKKEYGDKFEIVTPSLSILAEPTVAVVTKNVNKHDTRQVATAYLDYLYTEEGQRIAAQNYYRPINPKVAKEFEKNFPKLNLISINDFGGWDKAQAEHFADKGTFDQIYLKK